MRSPRPALLLPALGTLVVSLGWLAPAAMAQVQQFMLGPGSSVGNKTKVEPKNCVTDPVTGAITCDTTIVNPAGDTPARPQYEPFGN